MEQQSLYNLGLGLTGSSFTTAQQQRLATPVSGMYCPSRRAMGTYAVIAGNIAVGYQNASFPNPTSGTVLVARADYAANNGQCQLPAGATTAMLAYCGGICYQGSQVTMAMIKDGTSNTYLAGEKYINPDYYATGQDGGDDWTLYDGQQEDNERSVGYYATPSDPTTKLTYYPPYQDQSGYSSPNGNEAAPITCFGSAHASGFNMAFCDGSVRSISYSIDSETHRRLGNCMDGMPIDGSKL
jgi:prepilin-type processing-associated H-X9-DG protein